MKEIKHLIEEKAFFKFNRERVLELEVKVSKVDYQDGIISLWGHSDQNLSEDATICVKRRVIEHTIDYLDERNFSLKVNKEKFIFEIEIDKLLNMKLLEEGQVWYFYVNNGGHSYRLKIDHQLNLVYHPFTVNPLFKAKPYRAGDGGLGFLITMINLQANLESANYTNGELTPEILLQSNDVSANFFEKLTCQLVFKKREQMNLFQYDEEKVFYLNYQGSRCSATCHVNRMFNGDLENDEQAWDAFIRLYVTGQKSAEFPVYSTMNTAEAKYHYETLNSNNALKMKPYMTGKKTFSLLIRKKDIVAEVVELSLSDQVLNLKGQLYSPELDLSNLGNESMSLVVKKRFTYGNEFSYFEGEKSSLRLTPEGFEGVVDLSKIIDSTIQQELQSWDLFLEIKMGQNEKVDVLVSGAPSLPMDSTVRIKPKTQPLIISFSSNHKNQISIDVKKDKSTFSDDVIRLAVLGSCFSRNAFESKPYFNPEYKRFYQCTFTHIQSSIISLMSNPVSLELDDLKHMNKSEQLPIMRDFNKTFIRDLSQSKPEYLILDFLADAARDVFRISDDAYVSASLLLRQTNLYSELQRKSKVIDHQNNNDYFQLWKSAVDQFIEELLRIIPEERIILSKGQFTTRYYDEQGNVKSYSDSRQKLIRRNNVFWDKLNNYFINRLPNIKVIDLTSDGFIGHYAHPYGNNPSHYESGYYKEYLKRLDELVRNDLQLNR